MIKDHEEDSLQVKRTKSFRLGNTHVRKNIANHTVKI